MPRLSLSMMISKKIVFVFISTVAMISVMAVIFFFSGQQGSDSFEASNSMGAFILQLFGIKIPEGQDPNSVPILFGLTIRNCAHIFLFFWMGITSYLFVASICTYFRKERITKVEIMQTVIYSFLISVLYAGIDELHQLFVDGRTASMRDIGIDTIGIVIAVALSVLVNIMIAKRYNQLKINT